MGGFKEAAAHPIETLMGADLPSQTAEKQQMLEQAAQSTDPKVKELGQAGLASQELGQKPLVHVTDRPGFQKVLDPKSKNVISRALTGGTKTVEALSSPENLELLGTLPFAPEDAAQLLSGVFGAQMAQGAGTEGYQAIRAAHRGDYGEAAERGATALLNAAMAAAAAKHAAGEKPVLHESNDVEELRASAERQSDKIGDAAAAATEGVPGAKLEAVRDSKDADRIEDKAARQGVQPNQIADIAAAKITVPDQAAADKVLEKLHQEMPVESVNGSLDAAGKNGVRQVQAVVNTGAEGEPVKRAEVLIQTPEMNEATDRTHDDYRKSQELRAAGKIEEADALEKKITAEHEAAAKLSESNQGERGKVVSSGQTTEQAASAAEPKYKFGSTQTNIPKDSDAAQALATARGKIDEDDLMHTGYGGDGKGLETDPHVTVRYGIKGDDTAAIEKFLRSQAPFEATLGKTDAFPPSDHSDGAAPIIAHVHAPELHRMEAEMDKHGEFADRSFPEYKPHATLGYVKPEAAGKYKGMTDTEGKTFRVNSVAITDRDGNAKEIPLQGSPKLADRPTIKGHDGRATDVLTPARKMPSTYRLVEASDLKPSHSAHTFEENPDYPKGVQERDYKGSKEAQSRVIQQAQNYDPAYTVNTNPDAVNGPPVITPDGTVLGGNSRAMSTQRLYAEGNGDAYRETLKRDAATYGLKPEHVDGMKEPVLVRQIERPANVEEARRIGSELNKNMTGALGVSERAVSAGKSLKPETLRTVADMLQQDDSTLRELLAKRGPELLKMMQADGAITERERPQFIDQASGGLSEEGKTFFERALMGSVIDDPRLMNAAPKSILNKLERSLGSIASFGSRPDEWNLLPALRQAVAEHAAIEKNGSTVDLHLNQRSMFGPERNPVVDALVRTLDEKPNTVRTKLEQFARDSDQNPHGQSKMFGGGDAFDAFNHAFGSKLTDEEFHNATADILRTDPTRASEPKQEAAATRDAGVSERANGEPAPGRGAGDGRAPVPPAERTKPATAGAARPAELKAPTPPAKNEAFKPGGQNTPVEVRDANGNWSRGTLDYYNDGVNGTPRRGRVTMADGEKRNNIAVADMRLAKDGPVTGITSGVGEQTKPSHGAVAYDLDKTLAHYDGYKGPTEIGKPIESEVASLKRDLANGKDVWIFSARAADPEAVPAIKAWTKEHLGKELPVTNVKYPEFERFVDDRAEKPGYMEGKRAEQNDTNRDTEPREQLGMGEVPAGTGAGGGDRGGDGKGSATGDAVEAGRGATGRDAERPKADETVRGDQENPNITRERKDNDARLADRRKNFEAANKRSLAENAASHQSKVVAVAGRKALMLDPDGEGVWHRAFAKLKPNAAGQNPLGANAGWRGMMLTKQQVNTARAFLLGTAEDMRVAGVPDSGGFDRLAQALKEARNENGSALVLRGDYRADTAREEATHQWQMDHDLEKSEAMQAVADRPEFEEIAEKVREMGYRDAPPSTITSELMAKAMAGDTDFKITDEQRENLVRSFLTEAVEEKGPGILKNLPETDPRLKDVIREVRRGYDYGEQYDQRNERGGEQEVRGSIRQAGGKVREGDGTGADGTTGQRPSGEGGERSVPKERTAQGELKPPKPPDRSAEKKQTGSDEPVFQRAKAPKPPPSMALPGMEDADAERERVSAEEEGKQLSEQMRMPLKDISKNAGRMERDSPLFFGKGDQPLLFQRDKEVEASPAFRNWFGDSKAVEKDGTPAVLYHGTAADFDSFDTDKAGTRSADDTGDFGKGLYFADSPYTANNYVFDLKKNNKEAFNGAKIMPVYLRAENPLVLKAGDVLSGKFYEMVEGKTGAQGEGETPEERWYSLTPEQQSKAIKAAGYDSVHDTGYGQWAVFEPAQVKSALGNRGTFDVVNPNIMFQKVKGEENPVARSVSELVDDLKALPKGARGTALDRVASWTKDTVEDSLTRSGKALGGVPSGFEKAFAWAKATTAALVHDYRNPIEQTDWKTHAGQMQLANTETALKLQDLAKELKALAPKQLDRIAMTHWMEAAGSEAKLKEWQAGAKARAMQATGSDRARYLREAKEHYDHALKLTPEQKNLAQRLRQHFNDTLDIAKKNGLLEFGYRNYVMHLYEKAEAANILHLIDTSELNPDPSFIKRRFHDTFYSAEGAGLTPKSKDIGYLLTAYDKSMNEAIASRNFMRSLLDAKAPDGRPIAAIKTRGGWVIAKDSEAPEVLQQRERPKTLEGYRDFDRPQLRNFLFKPTTADLQGFDPKLFEEDPEKLAFRGDLIIHPKYASRVEDMLTPSWFERGEGGAQKLGSAIVKGSAFAKELMTAVAPFHMVQEGVHALEHKVNPFKLAKIDLSDKTQRLLASHGLTLTNYDAEGLFGTKALKGLGEFVPGVNKAMDALHSFSHWQFQDYIPRLKMAMATEAYERNVKRYPKLSEEQVAELTAKQSNAAFGNLNTTFDSIPRTKTFKTLLRLATFAPDFLESRIRFVGQAFTKYGGEQRAALIRGALAMYAVARVTNSLLNDGDAKWDAEHAFSIVRNGRSYSLRTVQGDILHAVTDPRGFIYNRLNPLTTRPIVEFLSGRDQMGRQKTAVSQVKDVAKSTLPFGIQKVIQTPDEDWLNSVLTSTGLESRNYRTPTEEAVHKLYIAGIPDSNDDEAKQAESRKLRGYEDKVRSGHMTPAQVWEKVETKEITPQEAGRTIQRAQRSRLQIEFSHLRLKDAIDVYAKATPLEQSELKPEFARKQAAIADLPESQREKTAEKMQELLAENNQK
jgi:hypothetical protein